MRNKFRGTNFLGWCFQSWARTLPLLTGLVALAFAIATFVDPFCWMSGGEECKFEPESFLSPYDGKGTALQMVGTGILYAVAALIWEFSNIRASIRAYIGDKYIQYIECLSLAGYFFVLIGLFYDLCEKNEHASRIILLVIAGLFWITGWAVILRELWRWSHTLIDKILLWRKTRLPQRHNRRAGRLD